MENATPSRTPEAEAIDAAIRSAIAAMPEGARCSRCGEGTPVRLLVLYSPAADSLILQPICAACAAAPELAVFDPGRLHRKELN